MKAKVILIILLCFFMQVRAWSGEGIQDSIPPKCLLPAIGGSLVLGASLLDFDHGGIRSGDAYSPSFSYKADEVLRFVPAVALVGMKALGVESRTKRWSELLVRSAVSTAIMGISVESTKRLVGRVRPDGSDERSFPSGHSSAAFLTASLFAKEYGHLNPWYSVAAYGVASSTALLRRVNDHHWTSDVMAGAGIGILSVELGYALSEMFYRGGKAAPLPLSPADVVRHTCGLYMHYSLPHALSGVVDGREVRSRFGYSVGMEVLHLFTSYVGVGGRMGITSSQMELLSADGWQVSARPLDHVSLLVGPHVSIPLHGGFGVGAHLHGGYGFYPRFYEADVSLSSSKGWGCEGGVSLSYLTRQCVSLRFSADYRSWEAPSPSFRHRGFSFGLSAGWGWR